MFQKELFQAFGLILNKSEKICLGIFKVKLNTHFYRAAIIFFLLFFSWLNPCLPFVALLHVQDRAQTPKFSVTLLWKAFGVPRQKHRVDLSLSNSYRANTLCVRRKRPK